MAKYTNVGQLRSGFTYQDLHSAEVLIGWLESPSRFRWVMLETEDGFLDDIQTCDEHGEVELLQIKFATDDSSCWDWQDLTKNEMGRKKAKQSLLQKWQRSVCDLRKSGMPLKKAALVTNRQPGPEIKASLNRNNNVDWEKISPQQQTLLSKHLNSESEAKVFISQFTFRFSDLPLETLEQALIVRFTRLGGTNEGWHSLLSHIARWINRADEPNPNRKITLHDIRIAAQWHFPPLIPEDFPVPHDYIAPVDWSRERIEQTLSATGSNTIVITGSPGAGKSTYLSWLTKRLIDRGSIVARHHYHISVNDDTPKRSDWETVANAIIAQLKHAMPDEGPDRNLTPNRVRDVLETIGCRQDKNSQVIVIIDGLDHVWRDLKNAEPVRQIFDLLLPPPPGITIIIGTQDINHDVIPTKVKSACPVSNWERVPPLNEIDVRQWLEFQRNRIGLNEEDDKAHLFDALVSAFHQASHGHPLVLHYILEDAIIQGLPIDVRHVKSEIDTTSTNTIAGYYQSLWGSIEPEGRALLHLLAGFPWTWPYNEFKVLLIAIFGIDKAEPAELSVRHILGAKNTRIKAFHDSLLSFTRNQPGHSAYIEALRPKVIQWLSTSAPLDLKWRYEWHEMMKLGNADNLINGPDLSWCIASIINGRDPDQIIDILAESGWAALKRGNIGLATERRFLCDALMQADETQSTISMIRSMAMLLLDSRQRNRDLDSIMDDSVCINDNAIGPIIEVSSRMERPECCARLSSVVKDRYNSLIHSKSATRSTKSRYHEIIPILIAANLDDGESAFKKHVEKTSREPVWCTTYNYISELIRLNATCRDTMYIRSEIKFIANSRLKCSRLAVEEVVRIALNDGFDPTSWLNADLSRNNGFYRCCVHFMKIPDIKHSGPSSVVDFEVVWAKDEFPNLDIFIDLSRSYFFECLANTLDGVAEDTPFNIGMQRNNIIDFVCKIRQAATTTARFIRSKQLNFTNVTSCFRNIIFTHNSDAGFDYRILQHSTVARIMCGINIDIDLLTTKCGFDYGLTPAALEATFAERQMFNSNWVEQSVSRRTPLRDQDIAALVLRREAEDLATSINPPHERVESYLKLSQFSFINSLPGSDHYLKLSAQNIFGHGYHKDITLFDVLDGINSDTGNSEVNISRLRKISPISQCLEKITDGDETRHYIHAFLDASLKFAPQYTPTLLRQIQRNGDSYSFDRFHSRYAGIISLESEFERSLAATYMDNKSLIELKKRSDLGERHASAILLSTLSYLGMQKSDLLDDDDDTQVRGATQVTAVDMDEIRQFPPSRIGEFLDKNIDRHYSNENRTVEWTKHWLQTDPHETLKYLDSFFRVRDTMPETKTAKLVVSKALEIGGTKLEWEWIIRYQRELFGWNSFYVGIQDVEWIWRIVRSRHHDRWLEFVVQTALPKWSHFTAAPNWSIRRMCAYLSIIEKDDHKRSLIDSSVNWVSCLAANMQLPSHAMHAENSDIPTPLILLTDRLDSPSRLVQERSIWELSRLISLGDPVRQQVISAIQKWNDIEPTEARSCLVATMLSMSMYAHGLSRECFDNIISSMRLVKSFGLQLISDDDMDSYRIPFDSDNDTSLFSSSDDVQTFSLDDFDRIVGAHLAPVFIRWASEIDNRGIAFTRQWQYEAYCMAKSNGLSLAINAHYDRYYHGGNGGAELEISDRMSMLLRSSYIRALHWSVLHHKLDDGLAKFHTIRASCLIDPAINAVKPDLRPSWWPNVHQEKYDKGEITSAIADALANVSSISSGKTIVTYSSGPIHHSELCDIGLSFRAFLQNSTGPDMPNKNDLTKVDREWTSCHAIPPRVSLPGVYMSFDDDQLIHVADWQLKPLAWRLETLPINWLNSQRDRSGIFLPPTWLLEGAPEIQCDESGISVSGNGKIFSRQKFWNDRIGARIYRNACSRVGVHCEISRELIAPYLDQGSSLCWIATLRETTRDSKYSNFPEPKVYNVGIFGGSRIIRT